jgi:S-formylglutathione hydrolase FrmB
MPSAILKHPVRYCILLPPGYDRQKARRYPVLYFLHGLGDDERSLVTSGAWNVAERLRQNGQLGEFLIVTPDGDRSFYINSRDGKVRYEDFFLREFLPYTERNYHAADVREGRGLGGVSMGGYGALRFAFQYPQRFGVVAAQMPALYEKLPPALAAAAGAGFGMRLDAFGSSPDQTYWEQMNPLRLAAARGATLRSLKIYFDCGDHDDYGFDAGARSLDRLLTSASVPHEFHIYPGGHDWSYAIAHFGDALQFEWRGIKGERK